MTRALVVLILALNAWAQQPAPAEPPEEDASLREKEYALNPVQAEKEFKIGQFYAKKGSWRAAANRFGEAAKWNPGFADAYFRHAEMLAKLGDTEKEREVLGQFLEVASDDKRAPDAQKRLKALTPPPPSSKK